MPRNFTRRYQDSVETDIADKIVRICCEPYFGSGRNPPALALVDRFRSLIKAGTCFHLRKHQKLTSACDDVDFAERASPAPRQNAESLRDQESCGPAFG